LNPMENPHLVAMIDAALKHLTHVRQIVLSTLEPLQESPRKGQPARSKPAKPTGIRKGTALKQVQQHDRLLPEQIQTAEKPTPPVETTRAIIRTGSRPRRLPPDRQKSTGATQATALHAQIPSKPVFVPASVIRTETIPLANHENVRTPRAVSPASLTAEFLAQQWLRQDTI
jgi:hypothetical protein